MLGIYFLPLGCTSYKKAVTTHAVIDDKIERDKLILGRKEIGIDTSVWHNKKIVITDVEFYEANEAGAKSRQSNLPIQLKTDSFTTPVKRIRHIVVESIEEQQARSNVSTSSGSVDVDKIEIKEHGDIREESAAASSRWKYSFIIGAIVGLVFLLLLRKLF